MTTPPRACGQIPRHSGLEPESRRFESNNDLMHILIDSRFRRNDEDFDFVHAPYGKDDLQITLMSGRGSSRRQSVTAILYRCYGVLRAPFAGPVATQWRRP